MKLPDHVDHLRTLITAAYDKQLARLGIGPTRQIALEKLLQELHARRQRFEELLRSHIDETGSYANAREKLLDELTFTLFNRIAALKVMEAANFFPPVITKQPEHGDRSFGHKAWLEIRPDMRSEELEGIREYILHAFNELGESLHLYSRSYPYALLPDAISLNEIIDAFNQVEKDPQVEQDIWHSDDVLGWLYESYNNAKKAAFKDSEEKTEYDKVSLQSQVYTPRWVVKFLVENSLGKLYLEMYPDSEIRHRFKIANAPKTREREPKLLHLIKLIDPACGSGNFLLYAFELLYELYLDQIENYGADYDKKDIPQLIVEHNLYGIDLDDRAVQLAQIGLYIKARKKQRTIGSLQFNVVSSDFYLPAYEDVRGIFEQGINLDRNQKALIEEIWGDLQNASKFGSLIRLDGKLKARLRELVSKREKVQSQMFSDTALGIKAKPVQPELFLEYDIEQEHRFASSFFSNLKTAVDQHAPTEGNSFLTSKTRDAVIFLELLNEEYDVAAANPPYTDSSDFGPELKIFIEGNYKTPYKFHTNLYATFIKRCYDFLGHRGYIAMLHPLTFMYIKTFEDVRKFILTETNINLLAELGLGGVFANSDVQVDVCMCIFEKGANINRGVYFDLKLYKNHTNKPSIFADIYQRYIGGISDKHVFTISQAKLKIIKSWPLIYWISDEFREKFELDSIETFCPPKSGMATADNNRFLRFWWELDKASLSNNVGDGKRWVMYSKGGPFQKWYGNLWLRINWENDAQELRNTGRAIFRNEEYYFKEGITYSASGSKGASFRSLPLNCVYDVGGASLFPIDKAYKLYSIALLNSKLASYIINCLNPTVNTQVGDIERIPFVKPNSFDANLIESLAKMNIEIIKYLLQFSIVEGEFKNSPLSTFSDFTLERRIKLYFDYEIRQLTQVLINEAIINEKIFRVYDLTELDKAMILEKEGESIGKLPVVAEARDAYLIENKTNKEFLLSHIRDFIDTLPVKVVTGDEQEAIVSDFSMLYQGNNDLESFCIRHQVNPINIWYWFKQANIIPKQRMNTLALEFLTDMIREILLEDDDGIVPLVPNTGEKILIERIEEKFREKGFSTAQYSSFDTVLGRSLSEYLNSYFFAAISNHLKLFKRLPATPFIWHLSSGPEQGFDCYIVIYKWSRDKLMRLQSIYIERRERALINRQTDLAGNNSAEAQNAKEKIFKQLKEIEIFKEKVDQLLAEGYAPILDNGVGKNIAPLQEKKMLPYDVLNSGELKIYLNADW